MLQMTMLPLFVEVTKADILEGKPSENHMCAIALALKRLQPTAEEVNVDQDEIVLSLGGIDYCVRTPKRMKTFIDRYDNGERVRPFSMALTLKSDEDAH